MAVGVILTSQDILPFFPHFFHMPGVRRQVYI